MMRLVVPVLLLAMTAANAADAPAQFNFTLPPLTVEQANMVLNKLGELPWKDSNAILQSLIAQADKQSKAMAAPQPPAQPPSPPATEPPQ